MTIIGSLTGGTVAWFTDTVESTNNVIQSGNLDMKVSYKPYGTNYTEWKEVTKTEKLFKENALYEPGYTEALWLKIENVGNLAFRYQTALNIVSEKAGINQAGESFKLSDYLVVKYANVTDTNMESIYPTRASLDNFAFGSAANSSEKSLNSKDLTLASNAVAFPKDDPAMGDYSTTYMLVILQMPTSVDNEANHNGNVPKIELGLNVVATQLAYESDSFGSDYDAKSEYPKLEIIDPNLPQAIMEVLPPEKLGITVNDDYAELAKNSWGLTLVTDNPLNLDCGLRFSSTETDLTGKNYGDWSVDFEITSTHGLDPLDTVNHLTMAGQYPLEPYIPAGEWIAFETAGFDVTANIPVRVMQGVGMRMSYEEIVNGVKEFQCGIITDKTYFEGQTITVKLCVYETDGHGNELADGRHEIDSFSYTIPAINP